MISLAHPLHVFFDPILVLIQFTSGFGVGAAVGMIKQVNGKALKLHGFARGYIFFFETRQNLIELSGSSLAAIV